MTIRDFIDFANSSKELKQSVDLNKTVVIIDGHHIQRQLCELSRTSLQDYKYFNYTAFAETIKSFFRRLKICQIVPIIVFDGLIDPNRYKEGIDRRISEIQTIQRREYNSNLRYESPTLRNYVFSSVASSFGVKITQTCSDSFASHLTALANKFMGPVVSQRRHLYFMDVKAGLLCGDHLIKGQLHFNKKHRYWFLRTEIIRMKSLAKKFVGLRTEVMPLLGVILENDFIDEKGIKSLSQQIKEWNIDDRVQVILNWVKGKSLDNCLETITKYLRPDAFDDNRSKSQQTLRKLLKLYKSEVNGIDSVIKRLSNESQTDGHSLKTLAKGDTDITLPNWFVDEYQKGIIRPALMNIVEHKTHILYPQIEDFSQPSSYECTLKLRKFLYGILRTEAETPFEIRTMDRTIIDPTSAGIDSLKEHTISPMRYITESQEIPFLGNIRNIVISERRKLFLSVMKTNEDFINRCKISLLMLEFVDQIELRDGMTFLIVVIRYLIGQNPDIDWKSTVSALVLSFMFHSNRELRSDPNLSILCQIQAKRKFNPRLVHFYAQIQACLHISHFINTILGMSFEEGKPYSFLNGIFIYNTTKSLQTVEEHDSYLKYLFRSSQSMEEVFNEINRLIVSDLIVECL